MAKVCGVYSILNKKNNKIYIGSSVNIHARWSRHRWMLNNNKHNNYHLQSAWTKYGSIEFEFNIIEICEIETLRERELIWISLFQSFDREKGYNLDKNIDGRLARSDETKEKIRQRRLANPHTMSDEARKRLSERVSGEKNINYGKPREQDVIDKIKVTKALNPAVGEKNPFFGKKHSEETKKKISENNEKRAISNRANRAIMTLEEEKEFFERWVAGETAKKLVKETTMSLSGFRKIIRKWDLRINGIRTIDERCIKRTERWKNTEKI